VLCHAVLCCTILCYCPSCRYITGLQAQLESSLCHLLTLLLPSDAPRLREPLKRDQQLLLSVAAKMLPMPAAGAAAPGAATQLPQLAGGSSGAGSCHSGFGGNAHAGGAASGAGSMLAAGMAGLELQDGDGSSSRSSRVLQQGVKAGGTALPVDPFSQGARLSADGVAVLQQAGSSSSPGGSSMTAANASASSTTPSSATAAVAEALSTDHGKTDVSGHHRTDVPQSSAAEASVGPGAQLQGGCCEPQQAVLSGLVSVLGPGVMDAWAKLAARG
jgi:hypothetical protein